MSQFVHDIAPPSQRLEANARPMPVDRRASASLVGQSEAVMAAALRYATEATKLAPEMGDPPAR